MPSFGRTVAVAVGHNPQPVAAVVGADGASRNNRRPAGVAETFQVSQHAVEAQTDEARHILAKDPAGPGNRHNPSNLRPEPAVICRAASLPGDGDRLAWDSGGNQVNWPEFVTAHLTHVTRPQRVRPMLGEHALAEGIDLDLAGDLHAEPGAGKVEAADPREE